MVCDDGWSSWAPKLRQIINKGKPPTKCFDVATKRSHWTCHRKCCVSYWHHSFCFVSLRSAVQIKYTLSSQIRDVAAFLICPFQGPCPAELQIKGPQLEASEITWWQTPSTLHIVLVILFLHVFLFPFFPHPMPVFIFVVFTWDKYPICHFSQYSNIMLQFTPKFFILLGTYPLPFSLKFVSSTTYAVWSFMKHYSMKHSG